MSGPAIIAEKLAKCYVIEHGAARSDSLREALMSSARRLLRRGPRPEKSTFWALRDISFRVEQGEIVGIIGRNGAGKSTLLKVLSRITRPSSGRAKAYGRLASLLEVGTGFHAELTGRENIYMNGAILGMSKREIDRQFDEIVAFSEVEKFLDTPVKRYSSGMYVRLAFAVAAHLQPDILIVDEVLAVGDASFQKRCLNKMESVQKDGRTVLFVSHSMASITRLCPRAILLDAGSVIADGPSGQVVKDYLQAGTGTTCSKEFSDLKTAPGTEVVRLRGVQVHSDGSAMGSVDIRKPVSIDLDYEVLQGGHPLVPFFHFYDEEGNCAFCTQDLEPSWRNRPKDPGRYVSTLELPGNFLAEGTYYVGPAVAEVDPVRLHIWEKDLVAFQVCDSLDGDSVRGDYAGPYPGVLRPALPWKTRAVP